MIKRQYINQENLQYSPVYLYNSHATEEKKYTHSNGSPKEMPNYEVSNKQYIYFIEFLLTSK